MNDEQDMTTVVLWAWAGLSQQHGQPVDGAAMTPPEERIARYTEGVCADGAAILCDGNPMSISEVLDVLNAPPIGDVDKPTEPGLLDYPTDDSGGLQPHDAWGGPDSGDADKRAQQAADAVGVTPHSDMRPFVEQAVKYARYFESRPTGGEDRAHWANVYNAENARKVAVQLAAVERERDDAIKTIADMAERFRAVNVSEAIKQTIGENVFALRERAEAAEANVLALTTRVEDAESDALRLHGDKMRLLNALIVISVDKRIPPWIRDLARAALEQASKAGGGA